MVVCTSIVSRPTVGGEGKQGHGGHCPVGLRRSRRPQGLPHLGQRGAAVDALTVPPVPLVLVATTRPPSTWLAALSRRRLPGLRKPSERPVTHRAGRTCGSNRRMHASAVTVHVLPCAVADAFSCKGPWPSASVRRRCGLRATRHRDRARYR